MIVWLPCVLVGVWATSAVIPGTEQPLIPEHFPANAVLSRMVTELSGPLLGGLLTAGILAAIMSSLDSQFVCLGTMFSHDVVMHHYGSERFTDKQKILLGRGFIVAIVAITYLLTFFPPPHIFDLAVWCFSGFASLFPLVIASLYWRRVTRAGAVASVLAMAGTWFWLFYVGLIARPADQAGDFLVLGMMPVAVIFAVSAATLVVVSLMTTPPPKEVVDKYFRRATS
jgi:SSS family solute:Na+ symporter